jgi:hypothetical protein
MLSGREFKQLAILHNITLVKFMHSDDFLRRPSCYQMGLNTIQKKIKPEGLGGFNFTFLESMPQTTKYCFSVTVPDDAVVIADDYGKFRTDKLMINFRYAETLSFCMYVTIYSPHFIQFVDNQTTELCEFVVCMDGMLLRYIRIQTPKICELAVLQNCASIKFVKRQSEKLCKLSVSADGMMLYYVRNKTPEICTRAVISKGCALQYVVDQTPEICRLAIRSDPAAIVFANFYN